MPTLCVLVIITGPARKPDSSTQVVPVISPLPFSVNHAANTGFDSESRPRGSTAVTPVRTGPEPTFNLPDPETNVVWPTTTPATSVMALRGPGVPSNGIPRSRARTFCGAETAGADAAAGEPAAMEPAAMAPAAKDPTATQVNATEASSRGTMPRPESRSRNLFSLMKSARAPEERA